MTDGPLLPPKIDPDIACTECGAHGAIEFDGGKLCPRCYSEKGACCAECEDER